MFKLGQDRNTDKVLVDMLCVAYAYELQAYHSYLHAYTTITGPLESVYAEIYKNFMDKELHHLEEVGKKIRVMGGTPPVEYPSIKLVQEAIYKGYDATITALQAGENKALEIYEKIHAAADKAGDLPLVLLIEEIIQEEEEHHDELERILMDVPGKNNVEMHDELVVEAKYATIITDKIKARSKKLAEIKEWPKVKNEVEMNKSALYWVKINKEIVKLLRQLGIDEDDVGIIDYDDEAYPKELRDLMRKRDAIQAQLSDFDIQWLVRFMADESDEEKKQSAFEIRKHKLAELIDDELARIKKQFRDAQSNVNSFIDELKRKHGDAPWEWKLNSAEEARLNELGRIEQHLLKQVKDLENAQKSGTNLTITDDNLYHYAKEWIKLNNEIRDMSEELGIDDDEDIVQLPYTLDNPMVNKIKGLARKRKELGQALDNFDSNWMQNYFGEEGEPMDEVESVMTTRDYR